MSMTVRVSEASLSKRIARGNALAGERLVERAGDLLPGDQRARNPRLAGERLR